MICVVSSCYWKFFVYTDQNDHTIPQVVGYKGLKTMENYKTVSPKLVAVVYENSDYKAFFGKIVVFGSAVAYGSWCYESFNVWWNQDKPFSQRNPDMTNNILRIIVEYGKQDPWTFYGSACDRIGVLSNWNVGLFGRRRSTQTHMTSSRPYGVPKQWNGGHVGVPRQSFCSLE